MFCNGFEVHLPVLQENVSSSLSFCGRLVMLRKGSVCISFVEAKESGLADCLRGHRLCVAAVCRRGLQHRKKKMQVILQEKSVHII